jgi:DNA-directed RNA polymerase
MDFEQLAQQYSNMIHSIIHKMHIYKNQDEFYQIGLIALWEASEKFDEEKGEFSHYAYMMIRGRLLQHLQKENKWEDACIHPDELYWDTIECETRLLEMEDLLSHFHHLSDLQKKWAVLHFFHGLSNRDIAEMEKVSIRKVQAWKELAMKKVFDKK